MTPRRNRRSLEQAIEHAPSPGQRAAAHYALALFHDNNSREADAIPHYEAALTFGLDASLRAHCLAYLASSLHKTSRLGEAFVRAREAESASTDEALDRFIRGLIARIEAMK